MQQYKIDFIKLLISAEALKFGEFTLKSGRVAPYFLNAGSFYTGDLVHKLGVAYAEAYLDAEFDSDVIFGPAYKGIPLSAVTTSVLYSNYEKNLAYCFNRKETKEYGMKDTLVGAPLEGKKIVLIDDVITAGTAVRETMSLLKENGDPEVQGILIAMNRMEKNNDGENALKSLEDEYGFRVFPIVDLDDVIEVLYNNEVDGKVYIDDNMMEIITNYRKQYGV